LNSLPQAHFICQNSIEIVVVQRYKPLETIYLIVFQLPTLQNSRLIGDFLLDGVSQVVINGVGGLEDIYKILGLFLLPSFSEIFLYTTFLN